MIFATLYILATFNAVPSYPEGADIPRNLTKEEIRYIERNPITVPRGITSPPEGPVQCVAEYDPTGAILLAWEGFSSIVAEMAANITTIGNADVIVVINLAKNHRHCRKLFHTEAMLIGFCLCTEQ
jgi:hypothetical protein